MLSAKGRTELAEPEIIIERDAVGAYRFTFETSDGQIIGRVSAGDGAGYKQRTPEEMERAAKVKIRQLCEGIAQASDEERYADRT
jgi:hypothetical protein